MKKTVFAIIVILVIAFAGAIYYVFSNLDAIVKAAIENFGSDAVKTSVRVEDVAIRLTEGAATINGLTIANPDGFTTPLAFSLGEITVDINLEKTDQAQIAVDAINIIAPEVFYEINAERKGSLNVLKDNLGIGAGGAGDTTADTRTGAGDSAPVMLDIARVEFRDASLHAMIAPLNNKDYELKLPALVLKDLQGTPEQISRQLLDRLIDHAEKEIRKQGLDQELAEIKARARQKIDEKKAELEQQADDRLDEEKQKAEDKLKKLFGN
ncbi:MAG: hypothetical protein PVF35_01380 [Gammaproteobacteria bacterium]|jgi:hypothetical protein